MSTLYKFLICSFLMISGVFVFAIPNQEKNPIQNQNNYLNNLRDDSNPNVVTQKNNLDILKSTQISNFNDQQTWSYVSYPGNNNNTGTDFTEFSPSLGTFANSNNSPFYLNYSETSCNTTCEDFYTYQDKPFYSPSRVINIGYDFGINFSLQRLLNKNDTNPNFSYTFGFLKGMDCSLANNLNYDSTSASLLKLDIRVDNIMKADDSFITMHKIIMDDASQKQFSLVSTFFAFEHIDPITNNQIYTAVITMNYEYQQYLIIDSFDNESSAKIDILNNILEMNREDHPIAPIVSGANLFPSSNNSSRSIWMTQKINPPFDTLTFLNPDAAIAIVSTYQYAIYDQSLQKLDRKDFDVYSSGEIRSILTMPNNCQVADTYTVIYVWPLSQLGDTFIVQDWTRATEERMGYMHTTLQGELINNGITYNQLFLLEPLGNTKMNFNSDGLNSFSLYLLIGVSVFLFIGINALLIWFLLDNNKKKVPEDV